MNWAVVLGIVIAALLLGLVILLKGAFLQLVGGIFLFVLFGFILYLVYKWIFAPGWKD